MRIIQTMRIALLGALAAAPVVLGAQSQSILGPPSEANHFIATPKGWVHPKTPWGEPDIQATLNMMQAAGVPLERCAGGGRPGGPPCDPNKAWWTEEEYKQRIAAASGRGDVSRQAAERGEFGRALLSGATDPATPQRQTTLIVDPPSGRLPALTPEGKRRALEMRSGWSLPGESPAFDWVTDFDSWDRCITRGMPSSMMPYRYNGGFRIWQAPHVVVFDLEMIHDTRVIFTDGRPPLPSLHKLYMGDSRGHWEGNTLVVDVTNFTPKTDYQGSRENLHLVERFTRNDANNLEYVVTMDDKTTWEKPWTVKVEMARQNQKANAIYDEPRCHDGNIALKDMLIGARTDDRAFAEGRGPDPATMCYLLCGTGNPEYAQQRQAGRSGGAAPPTRNQP
jgi:hypothetical protein